MEKLEVGEAAELRIRKRDRSDNSAFGSDDVTPPPQTCVDCVFAFVRARFKSYLSTFTTLGCIFIAVGLCLKLISVHYTQLYIGSYGEDSSAPLQTSPMSSLQSGGLRGGQKLPANVHAAGMTALGCKHTPGKHMTADSLGSLCLHTQLNVSGCCDTDSIAANADSLPTRFACHLCRKEDMCCPSFEACVSCCLAPEHDLQRHELRQHSSLFAYSRIAETEGFAFCSYKCRTSSASLLHENTYRSSMVHCYGPYAPTLEGRTTVNSDRSSLLPFLPDAGGKVIDVYFQQAAALYEQPQQPG